jgi:hypothetical protein
MALMDHEEVEGQYRRWTKATIKLNSGEGVNQG